MPLNDGGEDGTGGPEPQGRRSEVQRVVAALLGALLSPGVLKHTGVAALVQDLADDSADGQQQQQPEQPQQQQPAAAGALEAARGAAGDSKVAMNPHQLMLLGACASLLNVDELQAAATDLGLELPVATDPSMQCEMRAQMLHWAAVAAAEAQAAVPPGDKLTVDEVLKLTAAAAQLNERAGVPVEQPMRLLLPVYRQVKRQGKTLVSVAVMVARCQQGQVAAACAAAGGQDRLQEQIAAQLLSLASAALGTARPLQQPANGLEEKSVNVNTTPFAALRAAVHAALQGLDLTSDQQGAVVQPEVALALGDAVAAAKRKLLQIDGTALQPAQSEGLDADGLQAGIALHAAGCTSQAALAQGIANVLVLQRSLRWQLPMRAAVAAVAAGHVPGSAEGEVVLSLIRHACHIITDRVEGKGVDASPTSLQGPPRLLAPMQPS